MTEKNTTIRAFAMLLTSFGIACTGCLTPSGGKSSIATQSAPLPGTPNIPAIPRSPAPTTPSGPAPRMPGTPHIPTPNDQAATQPAPPSAVQQVGYLYPNVDVTPAGLRRRCNVSAGQNCGGCQSCGPVADCEPEPTFGYVEMAPQGWNVYGADPQEFVCDGGDHAPKAVVLKDDSVGGLQGEDTVVHYTTEAGDIKVQPSNRTCVYSPRFGSIRRITQAVAGDHTIALANVDRPLGPNGIGMNEGGRLVIDNTKLANADVTKRIDALRDLDPATPIDNAIRPLAEGHIWETMAVLAAVGPERLDGENLAIVQTGVASAIRWTVSNSVEIARTDVAPPQITQDVKVEGFTVYDFPDAGRLRIIKMADIAEGQPGDIVTFTIRVENVGDSPVNHVVLNDNLTTRLQYVEDSQESTKEADFSTDANSELSLRLEWNLKEELKVGEGVTFTFQCRLR